jgi:glycosyltransferase involved in cell wall biosynthesis
MATVEEREAVAARPRGVAGARPRVVAAIPCYNEASYIGEVVRRTAAHVDTVVVVDDGSTDGTAEAARAAGADVVEHEVNQGYGQAIRSCFEAAMVNGADVLVTIDGDGQHEPDEVPDVLRPLLAEEADLVIGSRFMGKSNEIPRYRTFGIDVITFLYNVGSPARVSDAQSGFRAYRREVLNDFDLGDSGMGVSVETLIQARQKGYRIREVPITCTYHSAGSTLNPVTHGVGVALAVIKHRLFAAWGTQD